MGLWWHASQALADQIQVCLCVSPNDRGSKRIGIFNILSHMHTSTPCLYAQAFVVESVLRTQLRIVTNLFFKQGLCKPPQERWGGGGKTESQEQTSKWCWTEKGKDSRCLASSMIAAHRTGAYGKCWTRHEAELTRLAPNNDKNHGTSQPPMSTTTYYVKNALLLCPATMKPCLWAKDKRILIVSCLLSLGQHLNLFWSIIKDNQVLPSAVSLQEHCGSHLVFQRHLGGLFPAFGFSVS